MEKFAPPEWVEVKNKILYQRSITLKDGVEYLFKLIDSSKKEEIISFVKREAKIRKGFNEFIDFCEKENIEFNVLSGGLDFFVNAVLSDYVNKIKIFCNAGNFNSEKIEIDYKYLPKSCYLCGECGCCKIEIIQWYPKDKYERVLIGDSLTDLASSKIADIVFARGDLVKYLNQEKINFIPFETFTEVKEQLVQKLSTKI